MIPSPILLQFFTALMHFQWEGTNTAVTRPVDRLWGLEFRRCAWGVATSTKLQNTITLSQQRCEIQHWFQRTTYRKLHIRSPMVTWLMTSRDLKRPRSWPQNLCFEAHYLNNHATKRSKSSPQYVTDDVTWPELSRSWPPYLWGSISQLLCEVDGVFKLNTYGKPYITSPMVTWPNDVTSRDLKGHCCDPLNLWGTITVN